MDTIGVVVAMDKEYRLMETLLSNKKIHDNHKNRLTEGTLGNKTVLLAKTGIGKICAAVGVLEMIRHFHPQAIINSGVAGSIDASLRVMDLVIGKEIVYHDVWCGEGNEYGQVQGMPPRYAADPHLYQTALHLKSDYPVHNGLICSGDQFITDRTALNDIKNKFPEGLAVDMESGAIAQVCHMYTTPFLSLRVISDTPGQVSDHSRQYRDFWSTAPETLFQILKQLLIAL